ncbi:MAG: family 2 glycosyltransferase [Spirochaetes bacterium]|nr:MAG: family 2 glycosyltransferase [Spirochaetota bacterium]
MIFYATFCLAIPSFMLAFTVLNTLWLMWSSLIPQETTGGKVSVLVPARNEAANLEACLESLIRQEYEDFEIIVYDDQSSDGTGAIIERFVKRYPETVFMIRGGPLPEGWYGKPHALHSLAKRARGSRLLFTDADTIHRSDSIGKAAGLANYYAADFVSGYVQHKAATLGDSLVFPMIYLLTMGYMPLWLTLQSLHPRISHAIGQFVFVDRAAYLLSGGYESVKDKVSEDVHFVRRMKRQGYRVVFADLKDQVSCRMFKDYRHAIDGISKNVYDYIEKKFPILAAATILLPLLVFLPIILSIWIPPFFPASSPLARIQPELRLSVLLSMFVWFVVALERKLPWYIPLLYPVIYVNTLSAAWRAHRIFSQGRGIVWKGRIVR